MGLLYSNTINSRADLDAIAGTLEHLNFMKALKGTMVRRQNVQTYPEGYGQPGYDGPPLEPIWEDVEDLSTIARFGFAKADFE
jgi:hypothetical protein